MITIKPVLDCVELKHGTEASYTRRWEYARGAALIMANSNIVFIYAATSREFKKILNRILILTEIYSGEDTKK